VEQPEVLFSKGDARAAWHPFPSASGRGKDNPKARPYAGPDVAFSASPRSVCLALAVLLAAPAPALARGRHPTPTPAPTPTPTPIPFLRAAGACLRYEPGAYIVLSEVGHPGRVFRINASTEITVIPRRGGRIRILYEDDPEGPIARKIMPGPEERRD
jgi:hypothetical protein